MISVVVGGWLGAREGGGASRVEGGDGGEGAGVKIGGDWQSQLVHSGPFDLGRRTRMTCGCRLTSKSFLAVSFTSACRLPPPQFMHPGAHSLQTQRQNPCGDLRHECADEQGEGPGCNSQAAFTNHGH